MDRIYRELETLKQLIDATEIKLFGILENQNTIDKKYQEIPSLFTELEKFMYCRDTLITILESLEYEKSSRSQSS